VLGLLLASWGHSALVTLTGTALPRAADLHLDWRVTAFAVGLSLLAGVLVGVAPAIQASREAPAEALQGTRGTVGGYRGRRLDVLAAFQAGAALVLVG
jgi:ABC-type antimicrobial peptide transport system permease subunit